MTPSWSKRIGPSEIIVVVECYLFIYIYIYIIVVQVIRPPAYFPREATCSFKNAFAAPVFLVAPERVFVLRLLPGGAAGFPNVTFSNTSAPACQKLYLFQMNF